MRILYVITGLELGGAEKQLLLIATNLKKIGHEIHIVAMKCGGILKTEFIAEGMSVTELDITGFTSLVKGTVRFRKLVKEFCPDVVHSHMVHANLYVRLLRIIVPLKKLICTAHNINEGGKGLMFLYRITNKLANLSTNVSKEALDHYLQIKAFSKANSLYVPNAIDTNLFFSDSFGNLDLRSKFGIKNEDFIFLAVGRLHAQKDYPTLLAAFKLVHEVNKATVLLIVGEGDLEMDLKQICEDLKINNAVNFLGRRNDVEVLMNMSDCFVLSSTFEGFGLVVAEAMATETPVIATDCGGVKEVMGGHGVLVPVGAIESFSEMMLKATSLRLPKEGLINSARAHVMKNYSLSNVTETWLKLYGENFKLK